MGGAIDFVLGLWTWHWAFWPSAGSVADFLLNANESCELAHIGVIDTEDPCLFCGTGRETGNDVHDPEDDSLDETRRNGTRRMRGRGPLTPHLYSPAHRKEARPSLTPWVRPYLSL